MLKIIEFQSKIALLNVFLLSFFSAKPEMLKDSIELSVSVDSVVHLPCVASGIPSVRYSWMYNGKIIQNEIDININQNNITIRRVMKHHEGFYQCIAKNRHGEALMTIHLRVVGKLFLIIYIQIKPVGMCVCVVEDDTPQSINPVGT